MFTGIIQDMGTVRKLARKGEDALLEVETALALDDVRIGDSIAVSGACLTVTTLGKKSLTFDVSAESLSKTSLGRLKPGDAVNLEKALRLSDFLGGHLVLGHVDCVGRIVEKTARAGSMVFGITVEAGLSKYVVAEGVQSPSTGSASRLIRAKATGFMLISSPTRRRRRRSSAKKRGIPSILKRTSSENTWRNS